MNERPFTKAAASAVLLLLLTAFFPAAPALFPQTAQRRLTVEEAVAAARANASEVKQKILELEKARYGVQEARASMLPEISLQASGSWLSNPPEGLTIEKGSFGSIPLPNLPSPKPLPDQDVVIAEDAEPTYFKLGVELMQPLFTWGKIRRGIELAALQEHIAAAELEGAENSTAEAVRRSYFAAVLARESAQALRETEQIFSRILEDSRTSYETGFVNLQTVLEAQARLAAVTAERIEAEGSERKALQALSYYSGIEANSLLLTSDFREPVRLPDPARLLEGALAASADLRSLELRLRQAEKLEQLERAGKPFKPDFSLSLSLDISGQRVPVLGDNWTDSWDTNFVISLGARTKLYDGGEAGAKTAAAGVSTELAREGLLQLRKGLELQLVQAVEEAAAAAARRQEKAAALELARERERNAKVSFENDLLTRQDYLSAQATLISARLEELLARYTVETALISLEALAGSAFD